MKRQSGVIARVLTEYAAMCRTTENWTQFSWTLASMELPRGLLVYSYYVFGPALRDKWQGVKGLFRSTDALEEHGNSVLVRFSSKRARLPEDERSGVAVIWRSESEADQAMVTVLAPTAVWESVCAIQLQGRSTQLTKPSLTQSAMQELLQSYEGKLVKAKLQVKSTSSHRWVFSGQRRRRASRRDWENVSVAEAFAEASDEGKWYNSITFEIAKEVADGKVRRTGCTTQIHRLGYARTSSPDHEYFGLLLPLLGAITRARYGALAGRSRRDTYGHGVRPLRIEYETPYFRDKSNNHNLIKALKSVPCFGHAVIHSNPHVHVSLTDYSDGSSFDLFVLSENRILLVPQVIASPSAIDRLLSTLFTRFPEGKLEEAGASA